MSVHVTYTLIKMWIGKCPQVPSQPQPCVEKHCSDFYHHSICFPLLPINRITQKELLFWWLTEYCLRPTTVFERAQVLEPEDRDLSPFFTP